jgi:hypothetical protein
MGRGTTGFACSIAIAVVLAAAPAVAAVGGSVFESSVYGYSIELPAGWAAIAATEGLDPGTPPLTGPPVTDVIAPRPDRMVSRMRLPALVVGAQPVAEGTTADEWSRTVRRIVREQKGCRAPSGTRRFEVDGEDAVLLRYPDCPRGSGLDHWWIALVHRGRGYHLVVWDDRDHAARGRARFRELVDSVEFDRSA